MILHGADSIWQLQSFVLSEAEQFDVLIIAKEKMEIASQQEMATIDEALSRQFSGSQHEVFRPENGTRM